MFIINTFHIMNIAGIFSFKPIFSFFVPLQTGENVRIRQSRTYVHITKCRKKFIFSSKTTQQNQKKKQKKKNLVFTVGDSMRSHIQI